MRISLALVVLAMATNFAVADRQTNLDHLHAGQRSIPPIGWIQFCRDNASECPTVTGNAQVVRLDHARWTELVRINLHFNRSIRPVTDEEQHGLLENWSFATTGRGDCEDYVLEKRRALIARGWPASALLVTVVLDKQGGGHAVLTVMTDRGEFVLDNQTDAILAWSDSGLTFIKRQSPANPNHWVDLGRVLGDRETITAGLKASPIKPAR